VTAKSLDAAGSATPSPESRRVLLTVEVEDYFHVGRFDSLISRDRWYRFEGRIEQNTRKALDLVEAFDVRATFFVLGWVAEKLPELVREIASRGHEVASLGYDHRTILEMGHPEFRADLVRTREALEQVTGRRVIGHRVPHYLGPYDLWALDILAEEGFAYDSSVKPLFRRFASEPWRRLAHVHRAGPRTLWEFPLSAWHLGLSIPIAGAGYFRHLPHPLVRRAVRRWLARHRQPFVMYFRVWELDPEQPHIRTAPLHERLRHYRNLDKMAGRLKDYFQEYEVTGIAAHLGLLDEAGRPPAASGAGRAAVAPETEATRIAAAPPSPAGPRTPVTVVVPCFNEEASLRYLANTLRSVDARLSGVYDLRFVFVDDASTDGTASLLDQVFGGRPGCTVVRHQGNRGVAAAILTGIRAARTEIVCSMDADCTYDPHELGGMIPLLADGVDMVTASPYHHEGAVRNVPGWRLALSRGASFLYRRVLSQPLHTYTSCFRVYRREAVAELELQEGGFLGVAEMLGRLILDGRKVVEYPAVLEVRSARPLEDEGHAGCGRAPQAAASPPRPETSRSRGGTSGAGCTQSVECRYAPAAPSARFPLAPSILDAIPVDRMGCMVQNSASLRGRSDRRRSQRRYRVPGFSRAATLRSRRRGG
jgi:polysaccharide deacetylase family protein (PEP-CTERM system associated)